jgi:hypothetical protein
MTTSNLATVSLEITPVNDLPVVTDDVYSIAEDAKLMVSASRLLANDIDVDGDPLTLVVLVGSGPNYGSILLQPAGSIIYSPQPDFLGEDRFEYFVRDREVFSETSATVSISISTPPGIPRHNNRLTNDVNDDAAVSALDALLIFNRLNYVGAERDSISPEVENRYYDVSGDGVLSAIDALLVINGLRRAANNGPAQPEQSTPSPGRWGHWQAQSGPLDSHQVSNDVAAILAADADELANRRRGRN